MMPEILKALRKILAAMMLSAASVIIMVSSYTYAEELTNDYGYFDNYGYDPYYYANTASDEPVTVNDQTSAEQDAEPETEQETDPVVLPKEPDGYEITTSDISGKIHVLKMSSGEGEAVLLESDGRYALFGTGNEESSAEIRKQLWDAGVTDLDILAIPDDDPGVTGGAAFIMDSFHVSRLFIQDDIPDQVTEVTDLIAKAESEGTEVIKSIPEGHTETLSRLTLMFVNCNDDGGNNSSYCIYVTDDYGNSVFITGNMTNENGAEAFILQEHPMISSVDILVAGHYGYSDSSGYAFIQYIDPECCIIPGAVLENMGNFIGTRADLHGNYYYAYGMSITAVLGDVLNVECSVPDEATGDDKKLVFNIYKSSEPETEEPAESETILEEPDNFTDEPGSPEEKPEISNLNSEPASAEESEEEMTEEHPGPESKDYPNAEVEGVISTGIPESTPDIENQLKDSDQEDGTDIQHEDPDDTNEELSKKSSDNEIQDDSSIEGEADGKEKIDPAVDISEEESTETVIEPEKEYYTVSFDTGDRGTVPESQLVEAGNTASDPGTVESEGLSFAGWFSDKAFNNYYSFNVPVTEDTILYARWNVNSYRIIFDPNGGSGSMQPQEVSYGAYAELKANSFWKEEYVFSGWCTAADGSGTWYHDCGQVYNLSSVDGEEITMYAQWEESCRVIEGNGQIITAGSGESLEFTLTGTDSEFLSVILDGRLLDPVEYASWDSIGVKVRISEETVEQLSAGEHMISFQFNDHVLRASFNIQPGPARTGDNGVFNIWIFSAAISICLIIASCAILIMRKRSLIR